MIGHVVASELAITHEVIGTTSQPTWQGWGRFKNVVPSLQIVEGLDLLNKELIREKVLRLQPDVIVNCAGVVKQSPLSKDVSRLYALNSEAPQILSRFSQDNGIRLVHISTDCVFDGAKGNYSDESTPTALDPYGHSKAQGEVSGPGVLTLRTSVVGREISGARGLLEWAISQRGRTVNGYKNARYSGLTADQFSEVVGLVIDRFPRISGIWNIASAPIDKFSLLKLFNATFDLQLDIQVNTDIRVDRTLSATRFSEATGWVAPSWDQMIHGFHAYAETRYDG